MAVLLDVSGAKNRRGGAEEGFLTGGERSW